MVKINMVKVTIEYDNINDTETIASEVSMESDVENESENDDSDDPEVLVEEIEMPEDIVSSDKIQKCGHCASTFMTKSNLKEHRRIPQSFQCVFCDKNFALEDNLSMHIEAHNVKCDQCPELVKSNEQVTEYKGTNHKEDVGNESKDDDSCGSSC